MTLLGLFAKQAPNRVFVSTLLGTCVGLAYSMLIPLALSSITTPRPGQDQDPAYVHTVLGVEVSNYRFAVVFGALCLFILVGRSVSQILLMRVALAATRNLRADTYRRILKAPIAQLEKVGPSRLLSAITADIRNVVQGATMMPHVLIASVSLLASLLYLLFLSPRLFTFVLEAVVFGVVTYQIPMAIGRKYFERGRTALDGLQEGIRGLIYGVKELKLSREKQDVYLDDVLLASEQAVLRNTRRANTIVVGASNYGELLTFAVVGILAFVFVSYRSIPAESLTGAVMALLYIAGPIGLIMNAIPQVMNAKVSLRRIQQIFDHMASEPASDGTAPLAPWRRIKVSEAVYHYDNGFTLGPVDCEIAKGEITFIVGGNGSGKSTLGKLLALHYPATSGAIWFGDVAIDKTSLNSARQHISAVFADYFLFDRLLTRSANVDEAAVQRYLVELKLDAKVSVRDRKFSTLALSEGQKRRLALLVAFLEDRDVYIFDEWAADQDPEFKRVFYHEIVPELKARDKAVVVISHDDRYFHIADQLLVLEDGRLIRSERSVSSLEAQLPAGILTGGVTCAT